MECPLLAASIIHHQVADTTTQSCAWNIWCVTNSGHLAVIVLPNFWNEENGLFVFWLFSSSLAVSVSLSASLMMLKLFLVSRWHCSTHWWQDSSPGKHMAEVNVSVTSVTTVCSTIWPLGRIFDFTLVFVLLELVFWYV